ncbi:MAG: hypothetical protein CMI67_09725 [Pelagibaca sp.]|nr:hypothetical protein [Pelagibaca sp.]
MLPTYWGFTAMQMGVEMISLQMRMAQAVYEAGVMQQKAFWNARQPLATASLMPAPMSMGICGPAALSGGGRPRANSGLKAVPAARRSHEPGTPV